MQDHFFLEAAQWPKWKILKEEIKKHPKFKALSFYDLVDVVIGEDGAPRLIKEGFTGIASYFVFTYNNPSKSGDFPGPLPFKTKAIMLGELVHQVSDLKEVQNLKVNPKVYRDDSGAEIYICDEVIFSPLFDSFSKKYLMSGPEDARALFAIGPKDQKRFGIEIVFYMLTNRFLPDNREERSEKLQEKIEELAFMTPRIPIKKGSGSLFCVMLNLENEMEEQAFIRPYKTFDEHSDIVFVTSKLRLLTGTLDRIEYDGEHIDSIFIPLIEWQREQRYH